MSIEGLNREELRMLRAALAMRSISYGEHAAWRRLMLKIDAALAGKRAGLGSTPMFREFRTSRRA